MMVVADPCFVERRGACRLDAPHESDIQQGMKIVVDRLPRKAPQVLPRDDSNRIGIEMPATVDRRQNREARRGDSHFHRPQLLLERFHICQHGTIIPHSLGFIKKQTGSR